MRKYFKAGFIMLFILSMAFTLQADEIYLKNKNVIKGLIENETDSEIVINIGIGKFTIEKEEIESVKRSEPQEREDLRTDWRKKDIRSGAFVPPGFEEIADKFQELKAMREKINISRNNLNAAKEEFEKNKTDIEKLVATRDKKSRELKDFDPKKNTSLYNDFVGEINSLNAEIASQSNSLKKLNDKSIELSKSLHQAIADYKDNLDNFAFYFNNELKLAEARELFPDEEYFFDNIKNELSDFENDFREEVISASKLNGNSLVIEARLNDAINCTMIVDTGASVVTITKNLAERLGIDLDSQVAGDIDIVLADGNRINAKAVYLKSVEVGGFRAENILAAVIDSPPAPGLDGLLGMSFLNNFRIKIDSNKNKLILESLK